MRQASNAMVKQSVGDAAIEGLHEVGLLGLGGKACGGSAALHVDYHEGKLGDYGKADAFALKGEAGA